MTSHEILERVRAIYADVDAAVATAGPKCEASGRCCRFTDWGHVLYLSMLEAEILLGGAPAYARPTSADVCPFQRDKLCAAREPRPLGCRIYFCDPAFQETGNRIMEAALQQLKALADECKLEWRYAPLHVFLNDPALAGVNRLPRTPESRVALPVTTTPTMIVGRTDNVSTDGVLPGDIVRHDASGR